MIILLLFKNLWHYVFDTIKDMIKMFKISEASAKVGLSVATIRYYAELDMIPSIKRNDENQRVFDDESITWLQGIKFLRELGMPLAEIKESIILCQKTGKAALNKRHELLLKQKVRAKQSVLDAQSRLDELENRLRLEDEIIKGHKQDSLSAARRFNQ